MRQPGDLERKSRIPTPRNAALAGTLVIALALPATAQWLDVRTAGIPRTPGGQPDLEAPAPTRDGRPDLSGIWIEAGAVVPPPEYFVNLARDFAEGAPMLPWARALRANRLERRSIDQPLSYCHPPGVPQINTTPVPFEIVESERMTVILYEVSGTFRQIFTDGRALPEDPDPTYLGYSIGRWEDDVFIVETIGFNEKTWLDASGHPHTDRLRVTERFHRRDFGHMDFEVTIDDPGAYSAPWTAAFEFLLMADTELLRVYCIENNRWPGPGMP